MALKVIKFNTKLLLFAKKQIAEETMRLSIQGGFKLNKARKTDQIMNSESRITPQTISAVPSENKSLDVRIWSFLIWAEFMLNSITLCCFLHIYAHLARRIWFAMKPKVKES